MPRTYREAPGDEPPSGQRALHAAALGCSLLIGPAVKISAELTKTVHMTWIKEHVLLGIKVAGEWQRDTPSLRIFRSAWSPVIQPQDRESAHGGSLAQIPRGPGGVPGPPCGNTVAAPYAMMKLAGDSLSGGGGGPGLRAWLLLGHVVPFLACSVARVFARIQTGRQDSCCPLAPAASAEDRSLVILGDHLSSSCPPALAQVRPHLPQDRLDGLDPSKSPGVDGLVVPPAVRTRHVAAEDRSKLANHVFVSYVQLKLGRLRSSRTARSSNGSFALK